MGRLLLAGTKAFAINFLILLALHWVPPVAFLVPIGTGYAAGWRMRASWKEGVVVALIMGLWMALVLIVVIQAISLLSAVNNLRLIEGNEIGYLVVSALIVLHLMLFAGFGAILGGYQARRTPEALAPEVAVAQ